MKQSISKQLLVGLQVTHACPMKCPACHFNDKVYPAQWNRATLAAGQTLSGMIRNMNHILFLVKGALHIRTLKNENHYLNDGQCMFFTGKEVPDITVRAPSEVIWLDFSNRVILNHRDTLATLVSLGCSRQGMMPVLPLHPRIKKLLDDLSLFDSPCHHLLKQYELLMNMAYTYSKEELAGFFQPILRPADDLRAFVISNYRNMEGVEDFARHAKMSKSCFIRKFRDAFGMTIHQWTMKQREKDLCEIILSGKRDVKEIAMQLKMDNPANLYQFCRKHFGCPISELIASLSDKGQGDSPECGL